MKTVGEILRQARMDKGYSLSDVEKATRIRVKFLHAMEEDTYDSLPSQAYAKGFVKNYSEFLGLNSTTMMAFFRRQTKDTPKSSLLPKGVADPLNRSFLTLTPTRFITLISISLMVLFLIYFGSQYQKLNINPPLTIDLPKTGTVTTQQKIDIIGKTDPDATVTIAGTSVLVRSDGKFFDQVSLEQGNNDITVVAISRFGRETSETVMVVKQ